MSVEDKGSGWWKRQIRPRVHLPGRPGGHSPVGSSAQLCSNLASSVWALRTGPANSWLHLCHLSPGKKQPFTWAIWVGVMPGQASEWRTHVGPIQHLHRAQGTLSRLLGQSGGPGKTLS